ncbi:amino acid ABC transporter substrate-binding protein [Alteromonas sp. a30]|uniref:amino acid ABC transporter substrate-binding protein n=1 Tax=Alteromonas sp. a30 TaxID=2730917 RepID=UPI00227D9C9C|nr:amino acid ABC transporter substrate-binding protein [Alteromonas sp. a30]MCY7297015.1 amino acid ABC transporter substrate-binding protein [Alteromonas sp. a30]
MRYWFVILGFITQLSHAATWRIAYPNSESLLDEQQSYPLQVLSLALEQTSVRYELIPTRKVLSQRRAIEQLKANREINILWARTDAVKEEELLAVRVPIYKGLNGLRLFLVDAESAELMQPIELLPELRRFIPVQGYDWPDTKILQANGFEVATGSSQSQMYRLLQTEQANFLPRSIIDIWDALDESELPDGVTIESRLAVHYPTATYFFFNKKNIVLANLVKTGLERAIYNGSFDKLFASVHREYLRKAELNKRIMFELKNPLLPKSTPLQDKALWFDAQSHLLKVVTPNEGASSRQPLKQKPSQTGTQ